VWAIYAIKEVSARIEYLQMFQGICICGVLNFACSILCRVVRRGGQICISWDFVIPNLHFHLLSFTLNTWLERFKIFIFFLLSAHPNYTGFFI
jgi:hypothetical protein